MPPPGFRDILARMILPKLRPSLIFAALAAFASVFLVLAGARTQTPSSSATPVALNDELRVTAYTKPEPLTLKLAGFKALPHKTITVHNEHSKADETYSGVRVSDLLAKLDPSLGHDLRGNALAGYVVATGSDGYVAVIAVAEIDTTFHSGEVVVADAMNGQPLDAKSGPFKLIVTEDKRPARWVRNLISLELKSAK